MSKEVIEFLKEIKARLENLEQSVEKFSRPRLNQMLTAEDVAFVLNCSKDHILKKCQANEITHSRPLGQVRFTIAQVERLIERTTIVASKRLKKERLKIKMRSKRPGGKSDSLPPASPPAF